MVDLVRFNRELDELLELESGLTAWEVGYVDSIDKARRRPGFCPAPGQASKVSQIYSDRVVAGEKAGGLKPEARSLKPGRLT